MINESNPVQPPYQKSRYNSLDDKLANRIRELWGVLPERSRYNSLDDKLANASDDTKTTIQIDVGMLRRFNEICRWTRRTQQKEFMTIIMEREAVMTRTYPVVLDEPTDAWFQEEAKLTGRSVPALIEECLREYLVEEKKDHV